MSCHWGHGPVPHWWLCTSVSVHTAHLYQRRTGAEKKRKCSFKRSQSDGGYVPAYVQYVLNLTWFVTQSFTGSQQQTNKSSTFKIVDRLLQLGNRSLSKLSSGLSLAEKSKTLRKDRIIVVLVEVSFFRKETMWQEKRGTERGSGPILEMLHLTFFFKVDNFKDVKSTWMTFL